MKRNITTRIAKLHILKLHINYSYARNFRYALACTTSMATKVVINARKKTYIK